LSQQLFVGFLVAKVAKLRNYEDDMNTDIHIYAPFTKADSDERIVEGYASTEAVDSQGEVVKLEALEKALPDYMKFANLREMHQWSAVGKTLQAKIDHKKRGLWIKGKIVDKEAWEKVKEKVYNGFSIGGKVLKKIGNVIYELILNEISLVDRPANPEAVFSLVKFEGGEIVEKQLPIAPYGMDDETYPGIKMADRLIAMAASVTVMLGECDRLNRPKKHIEKVLRSLKEAALFELQSDKEAIEKKLTENRLKQVQEISKLREQTDIIVAQKALGHNWVTAYFDQLKEVL